MVTVPILNLVAFCASSLSLSLAFCEMRTVFQPHRLIMKVSGDEAVKEFVQVPGSEQGVEEGT